MLAVRELMGLEPVAGLYQPLSGNDLRARGVFLEDAEAGDRLVSHRRARRATSSTTRSRTPRARAVALAARLRAGELTPCPQTCSRDGCRFPGSAAANDRLR